MGPTVFDGVGVLETANTEARKRHKTTVDWTGQMVKAVSRWLRRPWVLLGDGSFACLRLAWTCVQQDVVLISRLRLDAQLYDFPTIFSAITTWS